MIYFHSIWEHQKQSLPAGVARFKNTYTCLYIHISVFLFRLIVSGRAALVKCFYFEPFKFTAPERCDICRYIKSSFLSPPGCTALFASIAVAIVIAHLAVVVFQLTKLYFYMGPTSPNQLTKTNSALAESLRFCFWPNEMFWPAANWQLTPKSIPNRCPDPSQMKSAPAGELTSQKWLDVESWGTGELGAGEMCIWLAIVHHSPFRPVRSCKFNASGWVGQMQWAPAPGHGSIQRPRANSKRLLLVGQRVWVKVDGNGNGNGNGLQSGSCLGPISRAIN